MIFRLKRKKTKLSDDRPRKPGLLQRATIHTANRLQRLEARLSIGQKKLLLALFLLLFGGYSAAILLHTLNGKSATVQVLYPQRMVAPVLQPDLRTERNAPVDSVSIQRFAAVIDSLMQTETGRLQVERFFARRPGMRDTLFQLQQQFHHSKN